MKVTAREKLISAYSKGLDGGDWVLIVWLASQFKEMPTSVWVVVWVQFALCLISKIFYTADMQKESK